MGPDLIHHGATLKNKLGLNSSYPRREVLGLGMESESDGLGRPVAVLPWGAVPHQCNDDRSTLPCAARRARACHKRGGVGGQRPGADG